jgi:hypothetical protein
MQFKGRTQIFINDVVLLCTDRVRTYRPNAQPKAFDHKEDDNINRMRNVDWRENKKKKLTT